MFYPRRISPAIEKSIKANPVTAILGARQTGKTTLAKKLFAKQKNGIYLDLEKPSDRSVLSDAEQFFNLHKNAFIFLDEIQLMPDLFPLMRSIIDDHSYKIKFLVTGSASPDLLRQSSQSLAGRISYFELTPLLLLEIFHKKKLEDYWLKGGFPLSLLANDNEDSTNWRKNFVLTFLERDLRNFGYNIPPETLNRLWKMIAHVNGQILNYSQFSQSLGLSDTTIRKYIDILNNTYMVRTLQPFHYNVKKRIIKSPKIYIRDSGILNSLLNINDFNDLFSHPVYGSSWETLCIENIINTLKNWDPYYYRTSNGNELDLVLTKANKIIAVEFKANSSPSVSKGFWNAIDDLKIDEAYIIAPVKKAYPYKNNVWVYPISEFLRLHH